MKFSGDIDMALCHTYKYIITMDINQCCFYGNIIAMPYQIVLHIATETQKLFDQSSWNFQGK